MEKKAPIKIGGKLVPTTKSGLPNLIYLSKEEREVVKNYRDRKKKEKQKVLIDELEKLLEKL